MCDSDHDSCWFFSYFQGSNGSSQCDPLSIHYIWLRWKTMTAIWYYKHSYICCMGPGAIIVINFFLIFWAETKSQGGDGRGPHYEFGNMNCPCGGGFHPSGHQPWVKSNSDYIVNFVIKKRDKKKEIRWLQVDWTGHCTERLDLQNHIRAKVIFVNWQGRNIVSDRW